MDRGKKGTSATQYLKLVAQRLAARVQGLVSGMPLSQKDADRYLQIAKEAMTRRETKGL